MSERVPFIWGGMAALWKIAQNVARDPFEGFQTCPEDQLGNLQNAYGRVSTCAESQLSILNLVIFDGRKEEVRCIGPRRQLQGDVVGPPSHQVASRFV